MVDRVVLPTNVKPSHYVVDIDPNFETFVFSGTVIVDLIVKEPTNVITLNANELTISSSKIVYQGKEYVSTKIELQKEQETATLAFDETFTAGSQIKLHCIFTGTHNDKMAGFYRSGYTCKVDGVKKWMVVTQFEATDCRRAFPCWDEPALKATFDVTLNVDPAHTALSNMNQIKETEITKNGKVLKSCTFAKTPLMSTYLVAFAVGELEYIEAVARPQKPVDAKPITVRVYTNKGEKEQGRFGLDVGVRTLEFFSEYFDIPYPLPKMDMIAIPDFGSGAMENWGLVTYRTIYLLYDEKTSSARAKQNVAYVVGHELAHQWFGNLGTWQSKIDLLVTMEWWSDLWLNEGFATFVGWLAVDKLFPDWDIWTQFVIGDYSEGLSLDALASSHPIYVEVKSPAEINQIFDAISYSKGASLIRMLNAFLGQEVFMNGVRDYLKKFKYENAKTNDLWDYLSKASGKDVSSLMKSWIGKMGYPLVSVSAEEYDTVKKEQVLHLQQKRFLASESLLTEKKPEETIWWIPLNIVTSDSNVSLPIILSEPAGTIRFSYTSGAESFWKLNYNATGFYRVQRDEKKLADLSHLMSKHRAKFSTPDRISLVADAFELGKSGHGSTVGALEVLRNFSSEDNYNVLNEMAGQLGSLIEVCYREPENVKNGLKSLRKAIFAPKVESFDYPEGEDHLKGMTRTLIISNAARAGDESTIQELLRRLDLFLTGNENILHPNLRGTAYVTYLRTSNNAEKAFNDILNVYRTSKTTDQKLTALRCLGATNSLDHASRLLNEIALNKDIVRPQDIVYPLVGLAHNSPMPQQILPMLWQWCLKNWDLLVERYRPSLSLLGRVLEACTESRLGVEFIDEVERWSRGEELATAELRDKRAEDIKTVESKLKQTLERMKIRNNWIDRERVAITSWLSQHF